MREKKVSKKIREKTYTRLGTILHKVHGGPYGEVGVADLFGTLPDGRACYIETKAPGASLNTERVRNQLRWLEREAKLGAFTALVSSWEDLEGMFQDAGYLST